jgi:hypothetical protein
MVGTHSYTRLGVKMSSLMLQFLVLEGPSRKEDTEGGKWPSLKKLLRVRPRENKPR